MIVAAQGDLFDADVDALVNAVNCAGVMGKGIALQFKRRYPDVFNAYAVACKRGEVKIGQMYVVSTDQTTGPKYVIHFPTKKHWRSPSQLEYIDAGIEDLVRVVADYEIRSLAIPALGVGQGGLDWADVEPRLTAAFTDLPHVTARVYAPRSSLRSFGGPM